MSGRDQRGFLAGLLFQEHLHEAFRVVQFDGQQHVAQDRQQIVGLGDGGLAAQEEPARGAVGVAHQPVERGGRDAARLLPDALRQLDEVLGLRADFQERRAEERRVRQQLLRQRVQVEADVHVDDAVGEEVVVQNARALEVTRLGGDGFGRLVEIGQDEGGDRRQGLGGVGGFLQRFEPGGAFDDGVQVVRQHRRARLGQLLAFRLFLALREGGVGFEHEDGVVWVVQQVRLDEALEVARLCGQRLFDRRERRFEGDGREWIAVVQPGGERAQQDHQTAGERADSSARAG